MTQNLKRGDRCRDHQNRTGTVIDRQDDEVAVDWGWHPELGRFLASWVPLSMVEAA